MRQEHEPDPRLPVNQQDKRSVIPIELGDVDWLSVGLREEASKFFKLVSEGMFDSGPLK